MHSTCTALLFATDVWLRNMDEGLLTGNVFIDLKKAFDTVDHSTPLRKLCYYGIQSKSLNESEYMKIHIFHLISSTGTI